MSASAAVKQQAGLVERLAPKALALLQAGDYEAVTANFHGVDDPFFHSVVGAALLRQSDFAGAKTYLDSIPESEETLLKRKAAGLLPRLAEPLDPEPRVHLIILCHNREQYLEQALRQLAATDYRNYAVYIADNGSADNTAAIMREAIALFPDHVDVHVEELPTNLGRPVGHNWLLTKHDHSAAEYIAIGDDDLVDIPADWLTKMTRTAQLFPKAGAVGGKALNPSAQGEPAVVHGGVRRFLSFDERCYQMTNEGEAVDYGQFDCIDKTDHVIACLQIYDKKALDDVGLFDIRFSPCQCVDIEHHLRMRLKGYEIIYNGFIAFHHLRAMGRQTARSRALQGNALGNVVKLLHLHDHTKVTAFLERQAKERMQWLTEAEPAS